MPQGNVDFVLNHNNLIEKESVEKLLNTITPLDTQSLSTKQVNEIRRKYDILIDKMLLVYGVKSVKLRCIEFTVKKINY